MQFFQLTLIDILIISQSNLFPKCHIHGNTRARCVGVMSNSGTVREEESGPGAE